MAKKDDKTFSSADLVKSKNVFILKNYPELERIKPISYDDIMISNPPPIEYILYPWLPVQGIAFVYAATGVGKTLFTLNIAYTIAQGGSFLKYKSPKPRKILYVDGEMAYVQIYSRFMNIVSQQGELENKDNWLLLTPDKVAPFKIPKMETPEGQCFYNKLIDDNNIEVLIFDNLSTLSGIDENKAEEWKLIQDWLIELRSKGKTTIIVHHAGKDREGYRGTSRMLDCVDTAISLQDLSSNELEAEKNNTKKFKVEYKKNRSFGGQDAIPFEVKLTHAGWSFDSLEKTHTARIMEMIGLNMKVSEIQQEVRVSASYIYRVIRKSKVQS